MYLEDSFSENNFPLRWAKYEKSEKISFIHTNIKFQVRIICLLGIYSGMIGLKLEDCIQYYYTIHELLE